VTISATYANDFLDLLLGSGYDSARYTNLATCSVGLSSTAPTSSGGNITEPSGGSYAEVSVANNDTNWGASSGGTKANAAAITFPTPTASWGSVGYWFMKDSTGAFVCAGTLTGGAVSIGTGSTPAFAIGALTLTVS
jgi:hypothetical protein